MIIIIIVIIITTIITIIIIANNNNNALKFEYNSDICAQFTCYRTSDMLHKQFIHG